MRGTTPCLFDLSLIHYPVISIGLFPSGEIARNPSHSDFGTLTLLFQDDIGGLEIADMSSLSSERSATVERSGKFIRVDPIPRTVTVNVGYLLMKWSNGRWKSTVHRVLEPHRLKDQGSQDSSFKNIAEERGGSVETIPERYSIAYFGAPDPATIVEALPYCCGDQAPRWKPVNAGEYLRSKRAAMYS